jgi:uncharacterized protein YprB with RNaseH-like and TPR domain
MYAVVYAAEERAGVTESDDVRKRLEGLNRGPLPETKRSEADVAGLRRKLRKGKQPAEEPSRRATIAYRRDLPRSQPTPAPRVWVPGRHVVLEEAVSGREVTSPHGEASFLIGQTLAEHEADWEGVTSGFREGLLDPGSALRRRLARDCGLQDVGPEDVLFMDLETTGLGTTPLFLIGSMAWEGGDLVVRQYFARDYSEEAATISLFVEFAVEKRLLVTFNGKSFDLPYLRVRAAATGVRCGMAQVHFDLLHECRRVWRRKLPDCKLQTLERRICGRRRHLDIPGEEIPAAYHEFVRTGNAAVMVEVLRHNFLDLVTLAELMVRLPAR